MSAELRKQKPLEIEPQLTPETPEQKTETELSPEIIDLEASKKVGDVYVSLINELIGKGDMPKEITDGLPPAIKNKFESIISATKDFQEQQELTKSVKEMGAKEMLQQRFNKEGDVKILEDTSKYKLQELGKGIFVVSVDSDIYRQLLNAKQMSAQAVTIKIRDGVSFVMIPRYKEEKYKQFTENSLKENVPHEVNHLMWNNLREKGIVKSDEKDGDIKMAFQTFQEELLCRLCSDGAVSAYSHMSLMNKYQLDAFQKESPDKVEEISNRVLFLNNLLESVEDLLRESGFDKQTIIMSVMGAKNFDQLTDNFKKIKNNIGKQ